MERETLPVRNQYSQLKASLEGYEHTQSLHEEFLLLYELEDQLLLNGDILASEDFLVGRSVLIRQGEDRESASFYSGTVKEVFSDYMGKPTYIILDSGEEIPFHPRITHVAIIRNATKD